MTTAMVLIIAFGFALATVILVARRRRLQRQRRQSLGLAWLHSLRIMLAKVQQHRGLSGAFLNGRKELLLQLQSLQYDIERELREIPAADRWMEENQRWQGIASHWQRLVQHFQSNSAANNLIQHNLLIKNVLCMIDDMAQAHDLLALRSRDGKPLYVAWRDLLLASECVGQARALGTSILSSGSCDTVAKIRLRYLIQKIEASTAKVWAQIPASQENVDKLEILLKCIETELIGARSRISVPEYFAIATAAIDSLFEQYDTIIAHTDAR
ncbi:MAG: nitrate- and nitrite sensing domain-containing protein [Pseudomonadota bacterium]